MFYQRLQVERNIEGFNLLSGVNSLDELLEIKAGKVILNFVYFGKRIFLNIISPDIFFFTTLFNNILAPPILVSPEN